MKRKIILKKNFQTEAQTDKMIENTEMPVRKYGIVWKNI